MTHAHADVELPERIAALPRDKRGYPIPYIVLVDDDGTPNFVVNDIGKVQHAVEAKLCGVCGQALGEDTWFVGGPGAALLNGPVCAYGDGPMHHECMQFALKVCPHLLAELRGPVNLKPIVSKLEAQGIGARMNTMIPGVPDIFVAVHAADFECHGFDVGANFTVTRATIRAEEYWQRGVELDAEEGFVIAVAAAKALQQRLRDEAAAQIRAGARVQAISGSRAQRRALEKKAKKAARRA